MRHQANQRAFELAHVGTNISRDEQGNVGRKRDPLLLRFLLQDRDLSLEVWRLNVSDQSPLEAAAQPVFNFRQLFWRTVTRDHDLLHRFMQRIESMEELFL